MSHCRDKKSSETTWRKYLHLEEDIKIDPNDRMWVCTGISLIGSSSRLMWTRKWTFQFRKTSRICWLPDKILASLEGLCSTESVKSSTQFSTWADVWINLFIACIRFSSAGDQISMHGVTLTHCEKRVEFEWSDEAEIKFHFNVYTRNQHVLIRKTCMWFR